MRKRFKQALSVVLVTTLGVMGWRVLHPSEPIYQGKTLTQWTEGFISLGSYFQSSEAMRQMGTNPLPTLLKMLNAEDSRVKQVLMLFSHDPGRGVVHETPASEWHLRALYALGALGPAAAPAVPELIRLLEARNAETRCYTVQALGSLGARENIIVPALTNALKDPDAEVRLTVIANLGRIGKEADVAVPALTEQLRYGSSAAAIEQASIALRKFGPKAQRAVPMLLSRLEDTNGGIRFAAANALKVIDTAAAAKAGVE